MHVCMCVCVRACVVRPSLSEEQTQAPSLQGKQQLGPVYAFKTLYLSLSNQHTLHYEIICYFIFSADANFQQKM